MKYKPGLRFGHVWKRLLATVVTVSMVAAFIPVDEVLADNASSTGYQVDIIEQTGSEGFTHPGVGLTKSILENARAQIQAKADPWYSYYQAMAADSMASKTVTSSNGNSEGKPLSDAFDSQGFNSRFIADGLKVYTQALMYYFSGDETYRANAMKIIRVWEQMDPAKYVYFTDSHIHTGIPLNRMVTGAEILRYTTYQDATYAWTEQDTEKFTNNLIIPITETFQHNNNYFMNQHNYPILGAMAGYIFTDNRSRYNEAVEWWSVNSTAVNQGFNGSISALFRLVTENAVTGEKVDPPYVQHMEMGRDQAHGGGDLTNAAITTRMLLAQGTKLDPKDGTVSTDNDAVGPMEFLDNRILKAADYFWQYMLGYDTRWTPAPYAYYPDGSIKGIYTQLASAYWGRFNTTNFWDFYSYYTYKKGVDLKKEAPYYYEAFTKKLFLNWQNPDGGDDYWLYIPAEAKADAALFLPKQQTNASLTELEIRYTSFDKEHIATMQEGDTGFVRFNATEAGSKIAVLSAATGNKSIAFKIRTNGPATLEMSEGINDTITLPDTKGQWLYVPYTISQFQNFQDLLYIKVKGTPGTTVDIDNINKDAGTQLTPPVFKAGQGDMHVFAYTGAPVTFDLSATDPKNTDVVAYDSSILPQGATFNSSTGAFTWKPTQAGVYPFTISASDGTAITAVKVIITVTNDREKAVQAVIAPYDPHKTYVSASLDAYLAAYNNILTQISTADDQAFMQQLKALRSAVDGLVLLTPLLTDGSIDYPGIVTSTFGNGISSLTDGTADTFTGFLTYPNARHILDFGADYKVAATAFGLQGRMNFADRGAGITFYGSNDKVNWTRITAGETPMKDEMSVLAVDDAYKTERFRFIKLEMIDPQRDVLHDSIQNILELGELKIYGERFETGNKLESVSISSPQSVQGLVNTGNMVSVSFKAIEPISNVQVMIQGRQATTTSPDQKNWIAFLPMDTTMQPGKIQFTIDYKTSKNISADTVIFTTDNSSLVYVNKADFLDVSKLATVNASSAGYGSGGLPADKVGYLLFDGNTTTFGDLASGTGAYYNIDFGQGASVKLSGVVLMPRTGYAARMNGIVVKGSNDNATWTDLTGAVTGAVDNTWTYIDQFKNNQSYRYIQIFNSGAWSGNIAEVELHGQYDIPSLASKILGPSGYTTLSYYLYKQQADQIVQAFSQPGANKLALINELFEAGKQLVPSSTLTANKVAVAQSMVAASTTLWGNASVSKEANGWRAFDGDLTTYTDTTTNPAWIVVDLGAGNQRALGSFKFYPRNPAADHIARVNGAILQGSNDGVNFVDLYTISGVTTAQWYTVPITNATPFRYLRYYTATGGANVAELEFYEKTIDKTLLAYLLEQADQLNSELYTNSSLLPFNQALAAGAAVNSSNSSTQAQVDDAAAQLLTAQANLKYKTGVPLIAPISDITTAAETRVSFTVKTLNNMAGTVYSVSNLPAGASFNSSTGEFDWTPSREQGGTYNLLFIATAGGYSTSDKVTITVKGTPQLDPVASAELTARQAYTYKVPASEPAGQPLVYQAFNLPSGASFNPTSGTFSWTPEQADYGSHTVTFIVSSMNYSATQTLTLNVELYLYPAGDFTRSSYYVYHKQAERIAGEIAKPGANKQQLLSELTLAEASLVYNALSLYSFDGDLNNTFGATPATASGSPAYAADGKSGQAIQLSGSNNQYVQLPAGHALAQYDEITVAAWVNWAANSQWQRIFDFGTSSTQYMFLSPRSGSNTLRFAIKNGGGEQIVESDQLPLNQWVHVAVTLGGGTAKLYVNGVQKASAAITIKPSDFKPSLNYIGKSQFAADPLFNGKLDEFVVYNRALNADEIDGLYNGNATWRDNSLLELFLADAAKIELERYTADTREPLQAAVAAAQQVLDSASSTQRQIDDAADSLLQALEQLELIPYIESLGGVEVGTSVGIQPELPSVVNAVYSNKTVQPVPVVWNHIDPVQYSVPGSFTVNGAVYGTTLPAIAKVTVVDPDAPLPPTNLSASDITATSLVLNWSASTDNVAVTGYDVFRDGELTGTVTGATYEYSFTGLTPDTAYTFKVVAFDEAGNRTPSANYTAQTLPTSNQEKPDQMSPTPPTGLTATSVTSSSLVLNWTASMDNVAVTGYDVFRDGQLAATVTGTTHSYSFTGLTPDTTYTFKVVAFDEAGNRTPSTEYMARTAEVSGGSVTPPTSGSDLPVNESEPVVTGTQIQVKLAVKDGTAQATLSTESLNKAIASAIQDKEKTLLIDLKSDEQFSSISLKLPVDAWIKAKKEAVKYIVIKSGLASLNISTDAIPELSNQDELSLTIGTVKASELPASLVGALQGKPVLEFSLTAGGKFIEAFQGSKTVEVRIPYASMAGESKPGLVAAYINEQGQLEIVRNSKYDAETGELVFYAKHFSKYAVVFNSTAFTDLNSYSWAQDSINALSARQIINGVSSERFAPDLAVTRAEFLKMAMEAFELVQKGHTLTFTDTKPEQWYSVSVATAQALNIVTGYEDGSFGLDVAITREEMAVLVVRILTAAGIDLQKSENAASFKDATQISDYAASAVNDLFKAGVIKGQSADFFAPKSHTTRAEAAVLIARILGLN